MPAEKLYVFVNGFYVRPGHHFANECFCNFCALMKRLQKKPYMSNLQVPPITVKTRNSRFKKDERNSLHSVSFQSNYNYWKEFFVFCFFYNFAVVFSCQISTYLHFSLFNSIRREGFTDCLWVTKIRVCKVHISDLIKIKAISISFIPISKKFWCEFELKTSKYFFMKIIYGNNKIFYIAIHPSRVSIIASN